MDDNIYMEPSLVCSTSSGNTEDAALSGFYSSYDEVKCWRPSAILDFSDLSIGPYISFPACSKNFHPTSTRMFIFIRIDF